MIYKTIEILLKHSAWGFLPRRYTAAEETANWERLQYSPQVSAVWEKTDAISGMMRLHCLLPISFPHDEFHSRMRVVLHGKVLPQVRVEDVLARPDGKVHLDAECVVGQLASGVEPERGWRIVMHKDARVELEYLYRPDVTSHPTLALEQPDAPTPLVFTASDWFSPTTDVDRLATVKPPKA